MSSTNERPQVLIQRPGSIMPPVLMPAPPAGMAWRMHFKSDGSEDSRPHDGRWFWPERPLNADESECVDETTGEQLLWQIRFDEGVTFHAWLDEICELTEG